MINLSKRIFCSLCPLFAHVVIEKKILLLKPNKLLQHRINTVFHCVLLSLGFSQVKQKMVV